MAISVGSVRAYPNGFEFTVHVRLRHADETSDLMRADLFGWRRHRRSGPACLILWPDEPDTL